MPRPVNMLMLLVPLPFGEDGSVDAAAFDISGDSGTDTY